MDPSVLAVMPAVTPPPGVTSDFVNGEKYGLHSWLVATVVTCIVVSTVVVALRIFARVVVIKVIDWSDCMFSFPMMLQMHGLITCRLCHTGMGENCPQRKARPLLIGLFDKIAATKLTGQQIFTMAFMGGALAIDEKRRGRHQWDMSMLEYLQSTLVGIFMPSST